MFERHVRRTQPRDCETPRLSGRSSGVHEALTLSENIRSSCHASVSWESPPRPRAKATGACATSLSCWFEPLGSLVRGFRSGRDQGSGGEDEPKGYAYQHLATLNSGNEWSSEQLAKFYCGKNHIALRSTHHRASYSKHYWNSYKYQ